MNPGDVRKLPGVTRNTFVATNNLLRFPFVVVDEQPKITGRLMHVKAQCVVDRVLGAPAWLVPLRGRVIGLVIHVGFHFPQLCGYSVAANDEVVPPAAAT